MLNLLEKYYSDRYPRIMERLNSELLPEYFYHNTRHTEDVIQCTQVIGKHEGFSEEELALLKIAALFHDTGFLSQRQKHEEAGAKFFLEDVQDELPQNLIDQIVELILATQMPQAPKNALERVICDSDLDYLGRTDFEEIGNNLFKEMEFCKEITAISEWDKLQIQFLEKHCFHTSYSKEFREPIKQKHLLSLKSKLNFSNS
jgi:predicted metal-dependent HD superfamily phosphohydrolase